MDFQKSKRLDPRVTFSRSSAATYVEAGVVKTVPSNVARFEKEGLLIEEARTNSYPDSRAANLNFARATHVTSTTILAPDGSFAEKCAEDTQTGAHGLWSNIPGLANNTQTTFSIYAKAGEKHWLSIGFQDVSFGYNVYTAFDLSTGTIGTNKHTGTKIFRPASASITPAGNGWYRLSVSRGTNAANVFALMTASEPTGQSYNFSTFSYTGGSNGDGLYLFGPQVEEQSYSGGFATSYIPTAGSTVTRAADIAQITGTNFSDWFNQRQSTLYVQMAIKKIAGSQSFIWSFGGGQRIEGLDGYYPYEGLIYFADGSDTKYIGTGGAGTHRWDANVLTKCAYSWNFDDGTGSVSLEGKSLLTEANGSPGPVPSFPTGVSNFLLMGRTGQVKNSGHVARVSYYSEKLTDAQLEVLSQ